MIRSYMVIAWRNFRKNKIFSFINIAGLSIGLTCCMLITLYIINELQYDRYHVKAGQLYQVGTTFLHEGTEGSMPVTPAPMGQYMQMAFPEIAQTTRLASLFSEDKTLLRFQGPGGENKSFYENKGYLADSTFFRMFTYRFTEGNAENALTEPRTIVLSEEIAERIFGNQPALNKMIHVSSSTNGDGDYRITGVFAPIEKPSHIDARFFLSMKGGNVEGFIKDHRGDLAGNNMYYTYLELKPGTDARKLESKFDAFLDKYAGKELKAAGFGKKQFLVPLRDIHLYPKMRDNITAPGSTTYLYILGSVALFILVIASINFMNLSTARSSKRSAEVGIRKVFGAERKSLVGQFLGESVFLSIFAFLLALTATWLLIPVFSSISGKPLSFSFSENPILLTLFFLLSLGTGLLAGVYPAFYLSSFIPVKVLKGRFQNSLAAVSFRKGLVVFQFVISVLLIIASVVITKQMNFLRSADLGFDKDQQLIIPLRSETSKQIYLSLKNVLKNEPAVLHAGGSLYYPGIGNPADELFYRQGQSVHEAKRTQLNWVDAEYLQTLNIKPVAGRIFSEAFPADTNFRVVLNETAIHDIGFKSADESIGKKVFFDWRGKTYAHDIIGVVKDFHFEDLHLPIAPYGFQLNNSTTFNYLLVHVKSGGIPKALATLRTNWLRLNPLEPFEFNFLDSEFQKNYEAESKLSSLVEYFTALAILISCLGLFGLATFSAEQRTKEIGVRKVLGAGVSSIVALLSKDFLKLVALAIVIASPIAWLVMNKWLQDFAYRVQIGWAVFAITIVLALLVALTTVSFQAIRAAVANPMKSLRSE